MGGRNRQFCAWQDLSLPYLLLLRSRRQANILTVNSHGSTACVGLLSGCSTHYLLTYSLRLAAASVDASAPVARCQYSIGYNYPTKPGCIGILELMMLHVISDTCILQLPSKSTIIQISQDTSSRGEARWIPVINPRLHPVPLHQACELQCAGVEKKKKAPVVVKNMWGQYRHTGVGSWTALRFASKWLVRDRVIKRIFQPNSGEYPQRTELRRRQKVSLN